MSEEYVIIKRNLYYRPNSSGYTGVLKDAGRYSKEDAESHSDDACGVTCMPVSEAPKFTDACYQDIKERVQSEEIEQIQARLTQILGQVAIADKGNWRDAMDNIGAIAEGRFDGSSSGGENDE